MPSTPPDLEGVEHRYFDTAAGVTIHVAVAGPAEGTPVMLVHGFPQNWWEWHHLIGPLAADGHRVICPDLRGAGWSSAPDDPYLKTAMADDLCAVVAQLGVGPVRLVAHDWGGPVAFLMMLRHPEQVTGFYGLNTFAPWMPRDVALLGHFWRFWYQIPISMPVLGPRVLGDPGGRYLRLLLGWVGDGFSLPEEDVQLYVERLGQPGHAEAGSRWYRTFQRQEAPSWMRGEFDDARVDVPVRWLLGAGDPVLKPVLVRGLADRIADFELEVVDGVGHWVVEQEPDLVLERLRTFLRPP
jgi:pimeloyl-ACP methyl ester carboxylesterase